MKDKIQTFKAYIKEKKYLLATIEVLQWELETLAPRQGQEYLSEVLAYVSTKDYELSTSEVFQTLVKELLQEKSSFDLLLQKELEEVAEEIEKMKKIPADEYRDYAELCAKNQGIWEEAKQKNDFSFVEENLAKIFDYNRKFANYLRKEEKTLYDVLLRDYEKGMTCEKLDVFFTSLKAEIVPLLHDIQKKGKKHFSFLSSPVPKEVQKQFCSFLAEYLGFDFERGILAESEHPFTLNINKNDVRITTKYIENLPFSSIFSTIHETGHAIYEQQIGEKLLPTLLGSGGSMGLHESQSRFWENMIGRSLKFWKELYPALQKKFSNLQNVSLEEFYEAMNQVETSFIRTEADELTYCLHIMLRYELEKSLIEGKLSVKDLPKAWNEKMREYLGVEVSDNRQGVLQDVHWFAGLIGYFPSYALGNAYAAQLFHSMKQDLDLTEYSPETIQKIRLWLGKNIHQYGKCKTTTELIREITGEDLNPSYYIQYLKEKYKALYF
ncbi:MAG TPA: carboxypeptidase M32 [Fusobacterium sp.]|uniref:carboxypeptidase M32 n=1 Tax=Fusobacterium sp. TaxID=68766 RepID=UPI002F410CC5